MMIRAALLAAALFAIGAVTGCRPFLPMTQELRDQNRLTDADLKNLQYYVSSTITLRREVDAGGRQVTGNHKLILAAGKAIEEVVIEANTPGICVGVGPTMLSISFEQGTSVDFTPGSDSAAPAGPASAVPYLAPDPFPGNKNRPPDLLSGGYMVAIGPQNAVKFMGRLFEGVADTRSATLLIDAESLDQVKQRKVLPGLTLPDPLSSRTSARELLVVEAPVDLAAVERYLADVHPEMLSVLKERVHLAKNPPAPPPRPKRRR